jgi:gluconate kinase
MSVLGLDESGLSPLAREVLHGVRTLLDDVAPPALDLGMTKATRRDDGVEIVLAHARETAWSVWVQASRDLVVVGCAALHEEHREAVRALASVAALLHAEREVAGYDGARVRPDFR